MRSATLAVIALGCVAITGCQSTQDWMKSMEPKAIQAAEKRGRFELDCPAATAQVLNEQDVQPEARAVRFQAPIARSSRSACRAAASALRMSWCARTTAAATASRPTAGAESTSEEGKA